MDNIKTTSTDILVDKLIKLNTSHMGTAFETDNNDGERVKCYSFNDQYMEGNWVGKTARKFIEEKP